MTRPPPIRALFLDFDSTISTPIFVDRAHKWAVADDVALFCSMTPAERIANLGGSERVEALRTLLQELAAAGVTLHIISIGYSCAFGPHLQELGIIAQTVGSTAEPGSAAGASAAEGVSTRTAATELTSAAATLPAVACPICPSRVYGQDSTQLRAVQFVKGQLISQLMAASGWAFAEALFVDDSQDHIDKASLVCRTLHVAHGRGMQQQEYGAIRVAAGLL
jgi:hypothetical protein